MVGWVFFRSTSAPEALGYLAALAGFAKGTGVEFHVGMYWNIEVACGLIAGAVFCMPILPAILVWRERFLRDRENWPALQRALRTAFSLAAVAVFAALQAATVIMLAVSTYNPFIYYRF
jgi:alginate O-acetyltransferase complex protein AlgI